MRQTLQEYIEGRLACGGCILGVIAVGAILWALIELFTGLLKDFLEGWSFWLSCIPIFLFWFLACIVGAIAKRHRNKCIGATFLMGAVVQIALAVYHFDYACSSEQWLGWFDVVFTLALLLFGVSVMLAKEEEEPAPPVDTEDKNP